MHLRARSTADVSLAELNQLKHDLEPGIVLVVEPGRIHLRSEDPPAWVNLIADAPWWLQVMGAYASVYVLEIVKEAGKTTWTERAKLMQLAFDSANTIAQLSRRLLLFVRAQKRPTQLRLALPIPHDYFGVQYELVGREENVIAAEISLFVRHIPGIQEYLLQPSIRERVTGAVFISFLDSGSARVTWMERGSLEMQSVILPLPSEASYLPPADSTHGKNAGVEQAGRDDAGEA